MDEQIIKDIEDIKVRLGAIETAMKPEEQKKLPEDEMGMVDAVEKGMA
jgi:hypothetical protein